MHQDRPVPVSAIDHSVTGFARHWLLLTNLLMGIYVGGTVLAPVLMRLGLEGAGRLVYTLYSFVCHQLPQRSYFLFGPGGLDTYSREQVIAWGADPSYLRAFIGNAEVGFKLGIAERDIALYGTILLAGLTFALVRRRVRPLPGRVFLLLMVPIALDGFSHLVSEVSGLGFRESNGWLATLTANAFSELFYTGTSIGSFNWLMRTLTGAIFGLAAVWFAYPYLEKAFGDVVRLAPAQAQRGLAPVREPQAERRAPSEETGT